MQTIRENIETMKGYIREMSQTFQSTSQKCKQFSFFHHHRGAIDCNCFLFSLTREHGKASIGKYDTLPTSKHSI